MTRSRTDGPTVLQWTPPRPRRHTGSARVKTPAAGPAVLAQIVTTDPSPTARQVAELTAGLAIAEQVQQAAQEFAVDPSLITQMLTVAVESIGTIPPGAEQPGAGLTRRERDALTAAGTPLEPLPPAAERASTATATRTLTIALRALDVKQVADRLGRSEARVRQRLAERTLLGIRQGASWRVPEYQFTDTGELPGWDRVAPAFPPDVLPAAVERFLHQPHVDLMLDGEPATPRQWLLLTLDPEPVAQAVKDAYTPQ